MLAGGTAWLDEKDILFVQRRLVDATPCLPMGWCQTARTMSVIDSCMGVMDRGTNMAGGASRRWCAVRAQHRLARG
jgi:hypothetical protein